jgi:AAA+ superfamily predicted ATPase
MPLQSRQLVATSGLREAILKKAFGRRTKTPLQFIKKPSLIGKHLLTMGARLIGNGALARARQTRIPGK